MRTLIFLVISLLALFASCSKESSLNSGDISEFYNRADPPFQKFEIDLSDIDVIKTANAAIYFDKDDFVDLSGNIVTGKIQVEVLELVTKGQILLYGFQSASNGKLLESHGEFKVTASQFGKDIYLRAGAQYALHLYNPDPVEEMELFYLEEEDNWIEADQDSLSQNTVRISDGRDYPYITFPDRLGWINCDRIIDSLTGYSNVKLTMENGFTGNNTEAFLVLNDLNSVIKMSYDPAVKVFNALPIPNNEKIKIVTITYIEDDVFHFGITESTTISKQNIQIETRPMSFDDIKKEILDL